MGAGEIKAGAAYVELFVKGNITKSLDDIAKKFKKLGESITEIGKKLLGFGTAITAPLLIAAERFSAMGTRIKDMSDRTGIGVVALQELGFAAEQSGASIEDVETGSRKLSKSIYDAATGLKTAQIALKQLGLDYKDLQGLSPEEQFQRVAQELTALDDASTKSAVATALLGRGGTALIPTMAQLADNLARYRALGAAFTPEEAAAAHRFGDSITDLLTQFKALVFQVGEAVAGALQPFAGAATRVMKTIIDWARVHRPLIVGLLLTGAAILSTGAALLTFGLSLKAAGLAISGITGGIKLIGAVLAILTNPIVLITAAIAGLAAYFLYGTQTGQAMVAFLSAKFEQLKTTAITAFGGIADALSAGDIALAAKILWTALQLAWVQGTQELQNKWIVFKAGFVKVAYEAFYGVLDVAAIVSSKLQEVWAKAANAFVDAWHRAVEETTKMFDFLEQQEREREKRRIQRELAKPGLAKNVRELLVRQLANVDAQAEQVLAARQQKDDQEREQRERNLQDRLAKIKAERDKKLAENVDAEQAGRAAAQANASADIADLDQRKHDLEQQLADLRKRAGGEKSAVDNGGPSLIQKPQDPLSGLVSISAIKAQGTFNAFAVQGLQSTPVQDRIAKAAEETAKNTRVLKDLPSSPTYA